VLSGTESRLRWHDACKDLKIGILARRPGARWQFAYVPEVFFDYRQAAGRMITRTRGFRIADRGIRWDQARLSIPTGVAGLEREHAFCETEFFAPCQIAQISI